MALAMEFMDGNTKIRIMDDFCSAPDQAERDAQIKKRVYANALRAIRNDPSRYYALMERRGQGYEELGGMERAESWAEDQA